MNKISRIIGGLFILSGLAFLSGCIKDEFDVPDVNVPHVDFSANMTISELNQFYLDSIPSGFGIINQDIIIKGLVVANDQSGNIYKNIYIEDAVAGLQISLDQTNLYTSFRLGQRIYVKCKGLYLGEYGGVMQLGYLYNGAIGRIPSAYIKDHLFLDSLPGTVPTPKTLTIPGFTSSYLSMLVQIDSVNFAPGDIGLPFATTAATTNRKVYDQDGNSFDLRTSNYADFAGQPIPNGIGSIRGILSSYNGSWQFYIRDLNDLIGFGGVSPYILNEGFTTPGSLGTFSQYSVAGPEVWTQSTFGSDNFAKMSGYTSGVYTANEDWLISPAMDLDLYTAEKLKFFTMMNYGTAGDGSLKLYYSSDYSGTGNPNSATWTEVTGLTLSTGSWTKTNSGDVDLSAVTGSNVHIAFKYTCTTSNVATWELGGITLMGTPN